MNKTKKLIALISGGGGCEHGVSVASAENLAKLIDGSRYEILDVFINERGAWYIRTPKNDGDSRLTPTFPTRLGEKRGFLSDGKLVEVAAALPCLHGDFGEDGTVQGALTIAGIPYVGQDVYASAVTQDKIYTKLCAEHLGIPTADFVFCDGDPVDSARESSERKLGYPVVIKPARLGSSHGVSAVARREEFDAAYLAAAKRDTRILIEKLIRFDHELECAYFMGRLLPAGRILAHGELYDYESKYEKKTETEVCIGRYPEIEKQVTEYSAALVKLIGIRSLSRIDYFVTAGGEIYFNEINAFPGMTDSSLFPRMTEEMGYARGEFVNLLLDGVTD